MRKQCFSRCPGGEPQDRERANTYAFRAGAARTSMAAEPAPTHRRPRAARRVPRNAAQPPGLLEEGMTMLQHEDFGPLLRTKTLVVGSDGEQIGILVRIHL